MRLLLLIALLTGCASTPTHKQDVVLHDSFVAVHGCQRLGDFTTNYNLSGMFLLLGTEHEKRKAKTLIRQQAIRDFDADHVVVSDWDDNFSWFKIYSTAFRCN